MNECSNPKSIELRQQIVACFRSFQTNLQGSCCSSTVEVMEGSVFSSKQPERSGRMRRSLRCGLLSAIAILTLTTADCSASVAQTSPAAVTRGYTLLQRGWVNDAIAAFRQALRQFPQSLEARLGLAIAYQRAGQDANAWETYQQVLAQDPSNRRALAEVGLLGGYRPQWQVRGIEALTTLLELNPQDDRARAQRALLLGYQGRFAEAIADYEVLLDNNPPAAVLRGAAEVFVYSGDYQRGLQLFERFRATGNSLSDGAVLAYARALQETGNPAWAIQILEGRSQQMRQMNAASINWRAALAQAYQANQQTEAALRVLQPLQGNPEAALPLARAWSAIARQSNNPVLYEQAVRLYQQVLQQTDQPSIGFLIEVADVFSESVTMQPEALRLYQQLVRQYPQNISLNVKQLIVSQQLGQISREIFRQQMLNALQSLPESAAEQRAIARALIRLDPPDPALLSLYQNLHNGNAETPFLQFRIAQILLQQGNLTAATQALQIYRSTPVGSRDLAPELLQAEISRRSGDLEGSVQQYEALIASNPPQAILNDALQGLAGVRLMQGKLVEAIAAYDQLVAQNPQELRFQLGRASLAVRAQQMTRTEAERLLDQWLASQSASETPPELLSLVGVLPADPQRQTLYERLVESNPDDLSVQRRLIQVLANNNPEQAKARVDALISNNPDDPLVYFVQAELAQVMGNLDQAAQSYEQVLKQQPDHVGALSALGGVRFQQQQFSEANRLFSRVLQLQPNDLETRRVLAELSVAQNQPLEALERFRALQQQTQNAGVTDPLVQQRIRETRVNLLRQRGFQPFWERF